VISQLFARTVLPAPPPVHLMSEVVFGGIVVIAAAVGVLAIYPRRNTKHRLTIIGDVFCDVLASGVSVLPQWGEDSTASNEVVLRAGGSGLNTAVWVDSLGEEIAVRIPRVYGRRDTHFTETIRNCLRTTGIVVIDPITHPEILEDELEQEVEQDRLDWRTGVCLCISGAYDRSFVSYRGGNGKFQYSDFESRALVPYNTTHVHIAGFYNCPGIWGESTVEFISECRKRNGVKTISLNPQFSQNWGGGIHEILPLVDFFICNELEAFGITNERDIIAAAMNLGKSCNCVIVTLGAEGALVMRKCIDLRPVRVLCKDALEGFKVDTVGVGDAFCGGFLHEVIMNDLTPESPGIIDAVMFGCACGTAALTVLGGSTFPGLHTIRQCLID
jgi:sugar/nucleoside kinase (ribokinase family)